MLKLLNWIVENFYPDKMIWGPRCSPFYLIENHAESDVKGRSSVMLSAIYIAAYCNKHGATHFTGEIKGLTSSGKDFGDWIVKVEKLDCAGNSVSGEARAGEGK